MLCFVHSSSSPVSSISVSNRYHPPSCLGQKSGFLFSSPSNSRYFQSVSRVYLFVFISPNPNHCHLSRTTGVPTGPLTSVLAASSSIPHAAATGSQVLPLSSLRSFIGSTYAFRRNSKSPTMPYAVPRDPTLPSFQILSPATHLLAHLHYHLSVSQTNDYLLSIGLWHTSFLPPTILLPWLLTAWLLMFYTSPYLPPPFCVGWNPS